ncbi:probable cytochrome P450 6a13 isoform X2 [Periplaneta americana]
MNTVIIYLFLALGVALFGVLVILYAYFKYSFSYWKKKGVTYLEPTFPFGNLRDTVFQKQNIGLLFQDIYNQLEGNDIGGVYSFARPTLVLRDPEIIKTFLVKDFIHFHDHGTYFDEVSDPLNANLFMLSGIKWRNMRTKLTPTFTSGKMKMTFQILIECGKELEKYINEYAVCGEKIEVKDILAKYSTDVIASFAFGLQCNCLKNPDAEFRQWGRKIFETSIKSGIRDIFMFLSPTLGAIFKIPFVPPDVTRYFTKMVNETIEYRENNNVTRNDFIQLLINLKNKGTIEKDSPCKSQMNGHSTTENDKETSFTMADVAAQAFVFFVAGFETSSTTMTFCLYELALNPDVQERLQAEIDAVLKQHGNEITYDAIQEMDYLDRAIAETLRKYPPVPLLTRECTKAYTIPGKNIHLEKGMSVVIPTMGIHKDPKFYPNPERFDPDRFREEVKNQRHHFTYLPFGEGPRICIGMRFGLLQTKVGLISVLSKNSVQVCEKTQVPLKLVPKGIIPSPEGGMWLKIVKRK